MNLASQHSARSELVRRHYWMLVNTLSGLYAKALDAQESLDVARRHAMRDASRAAAVFLDWFDAMVDEYVLTIVANAQTVSGVSLDAVARSMQDEYVREAQADIKAQMRVVINGNVQLLLTALRRAELALSLIDRRSAFSKASALLRFRAQAAGSIKFVTPDRLGRNLASDAYVGLLVRGALVDMTTELTVFDLAKAGHDIAMVAYDDKTHSQHGTLFSISGSNPAFLSYAEVATLFHPNSDATVVPSVTAKG